MDSIKDMMGNNSTKSDRRISLKISNDNSEMFNEVKKYFVEQYGTSNISNNKVVELMLQFFQQNLLLNHLSIQELTDGLSNDRANDRLAQMDKNLTSLIHLNLMMARANNFVDRVSTENFESMYGDSKTANVWSRAKQLTEEEIHRRQTEKG